MDSKGRSDGEIEREWAEHMCPCPWKPYQVTVMLLCFQGVGVGKDKGFCSGTGE